MGLTDWLARRRARRVANTVTSLTEDYPPAPPPPPPPRRITGSPPSNLAAAVRSAERRAELADEVAERAVARAKDAEANAAGLQAAKLELESELQQLQARADILRGVVERVVNDPLSDRKKVQGVLVSALQRYYTGPV